MLAAISGAKQAKKQEAGEAKRLEGVFAGLEAFVDGECVPALLATIDDAGLHGGIGVAFGNVLRRAKEALNELVQQDAVACRKQLYDKDQWWKVKLETARASVKGRMREQQLQLEDKAATELKARLRECRDELLGDGSAALANALARAEELEEETKQLQRELELGCGTQSIGVKAFASEFLSHAQRAQHPVHPVHRCALRACCAGT